MSKNRAEGERTPREVKDLGTEEDLERLV